VAGPLKGIRVLDLSRILAGPWAAQCLADLGADVIKIERPGSGDDTRSWGPPFFGDEEDGFSAYFMCANRGKQSVAVDMMTEEGREIIRKLALQSDVVVENFKVGGLKKYGLDYDSLKQLNPGLIYCSITGFGYSGPYQDRPGYDLLIQALGGLMSITGEADDQPGGGPQRAGVAVTDLFTGLYSTIGVLGALHHKEKTGEGQHIDMALLDTQVAVLANQASNYLVSGKAPVRQGNSHPTIVPYQSFKTKDGYMILAVGNDGQFKRFCDVVGMSGLATDIRFSTNPERVKHREELVPIVAGIIAGRTTDDWIGLLADANVPGGPINTIDRVFDDPQVKARNIQMAIKNTEGDMMPGVACPIRFSETAIDYTIAPQSTGQSTHKVLVDVLKLTEDELAALKAKKAIA